MALADFKPDLQTFTPDATMDTDWRPTGDQAATATFEWIFPSFDFDPNETFDFDSLLNPMPDCESSLLKHFECELTGITVAVERSPEPLF